MARFQSYRTNQFYKLNAKKDPVVGTVAGPGGLKQGGLNAKNPTNEKFLYPGPTRHRMGRNGKMVETKVQRGFMRLLLPKDSGVDTNYRFFFQFNPQAIQRAVTVSEDIRNPLLQAPEELVQPIYGRTLFQFDMILDRSMEMNGPVQSITGARRQGTADTMDRLSNVPDPLSQMSPSVIGVLSDIRMLDTIVGQGISDALVDYIVRRDISYANNAAAASASDSGEESAAQATFDADEFRQQLKTNIGNQAFLTPMPVRVVFSSLFMVDGFVTGMDVKYVRFNENMVPITARIDVTMNAKYIGFARPDTVLASAATEYESVKGGGGGQFRPDDSVYTDAKAIISKVKSFELSVGGEDKNDDPKLSHEYEPIPPPTVVQACHFADGPSNLEIAYAFQDFPDKKSKNSDHVYQALNDQTITGWSLNDIKFTITRKGYGPAETAQKVDKVTLMNFSTGSLFSATGTNAAETWWEQTTMNANLDGFEVSNSSVNGEKYRPVTNTAWQTSDDRLLLAPGVWDDWKREGANDRTELDWKLDVYVTVTTRDGRSIPVEYNGEGTIRYNQTLRVTATLNTAALSKLEKSSTGTKKKKKKSGGNTGGGGSSAGGTGLNRR